MLFYYLSKSPSIRKTLKYELDTIFGPLATSTAIAIRKDPYILNSLSYTTAVIKETLRLFPPANTVRIGSSSVSITDPNTKTQYPTHDLVVWPDSYVIGRDERYFPRPLSFIPERWLADKSEWPLPQAAAFRAFERGPRGCIGAEFGMLELKVVVAIAVRFFEFVPQYDAGCANIDGEPCYQVRFA
jgi:cytochrome P450